MGVVCAASSPPDARRGSTSVHTMPGMAGTVGALLLACSLALASGQRVTFDAGSYLVRSHLELGRQYKFAPSHAFAAHGVNPSQAVC